MNYYVRVCCILWSCKLRLPKIIKTFHLVLILPNPETGPEYTKAYLTHFPTLLTTRYAWKTLTEVWICWLDLRSCVPTRAQLVTRKINIRVTLWVTLTSKAKQSRTTLSPIQSSFKTCPIFNSFLHFSYIISWNFFCDSNQIINNQWLLAKWNSWARGKARMRYGPESPLTSNP